MNGDVPILERIHATLAERLALAIPDAQVVRNYETPVDLAAAPGRRWVGIEDGSELVLEDFNLERRATVDIPVTCMVGTDYPDELGPALSRLYGQVLNTITPAYQLGGLAENVTYRGSEVEIVTTDAAHPIGTRVCHFVVQYAVPWNDVTQLSDC